MSFLALNSKRIGSGAQAVLLLHGWRHSLQSLLPLGELLAPYYDVHLIDLPGFGQTPLPDEPWGTPEYASAVCRYLDEHGLKNVICAGHSFGGKVSSYVAATRPDLVSHLVLIDASTLRPHRTYRKRLRFWAIRNFGKTLKWIENTFGIKWWSGYFVGKFASADYKAAGALRNTFVKIVNEDLSSKVRQIGAPTLLLWGQKDGETPVEIAYRLHDMLPRSELVVFEEKDHEPFRDAGAHLCAYYIRRFIQEVRGGGATPPSAGTDVSMRAVGEG